MPYSARALTINQAAGVVLGQTAFTSNGISPSSTTLNVPSAVTFDSHGDLWVADSSNNRVLEYLAPMTIGEAASVVLGQTGFDSEDCRGASSSPSPTTLCAPSALAFDLHGNLWVTDEANNRVLEFVKGAGFTTGQTASLVIGQNSFVSGDCDGTIGLASSTTLCYPYGIAFDSHGNLWVSDSSDKRVLEFTGGSGFTTGQAATMVLGEPGYSTVSVCSISTVLCVPYGIAFDSSDNLWVADQFYNRVIEYLEGTGFAIGEMPSLAIGQSSLTSVQLATPTNLNLPTGEAFDSSGDLWVADTNNNRILEYTAPFTVGEAATVAIGQASLTSGDCDSSPYYFANSTAISSVTDSELCQPNGIAFDSQGNLWVADTGNNRVIEFVKGSGFATGQAASLVIGQTGFDSGRCVLFSPDRASLCSPSALAFGSSENLWVADSGNSRVLEYLKGSGFTTDQAASLVLGEPNFTSDDCHGVLTGIASSTTLCYPYGVAFDSSGNLWVADLANNRAIEYLRGSGFTTDQAASLVTGQTGFTASDCGGNSLALIPSPSTLCGPAALAFDSQGNLWVADTGNNRVIQYNNRVTEPIAVTFDKVNGGSPQMVTVSGCAPETPALAGNGASNDIGLSGGCNFALNLPAGYQWETSDSSTSCGSGICTSFTATYQAVRPSTVTQPITATFDPTNGGSQQSVTVSGCSPNPSTLSGDGILNDINMTSSCSFSLGLPSGYQWEGGSTATSCGSGTCAGFDAAYEVAPVTQPITATFDTTYSGSAQTITISGCSASPSTFAGDGTSHSFNLTASCDFSFRLPSGYEFISGGSGTSCSSGTCGGVTASYRQTPTTQPVGASLDTINGGIPQTVTVTGSCAQSPSALDGNGTVRDIIMAPSCSFSLTIPPGYQWEGTSSDISCSSGRCSSFDATYAANPPVSVTQPIRVNFDGSNRGVAQTIIITSCNSIPSIFSGNGIANEFIMSPSCSYSLALPDGYQWTTGSGSTSCSSGTCSGFSATYEATIPVSVPEFPSGSGLFAAAIGIFVLAALSRARNSRRSANG
ncbi:MAG: hypothetical protein OK474_03325 [Thaumarchaeota archaeon]|nr:hypothetical protein [Nitrososphaerota archaeon]